MRLLESRKGLPCFAFEHSEEYEQMQLQFLSAMETMEPSNIVVCTPQRPAPAMAQHTASERLQASAHWGSVRRSWGCGGVWGQRPGT